MVCISNRRHWLGAACAAASLALVGRHTGAQTPLRVLVGSSAGSVPDVIARQIADRLGGPGRAVVDNKVGAAGRLAISELRTAAADGNTLLLAPGAVATMYPAIYSQLAYDAGADLLPVSTAAELSLALAIGPAVPPSVRSLKDFVEWAKSPGAQASFGSPGAGTPPHVLAALFATSAAMPWTHVPYGGGPPAINDLLGGRLVATVLPEGLLRQHAAQSTLRLLATSGAQRSTFTPEVPTFAEQGYADVVLREWFGFFAPAGTPASVVRMRAEQVQRACADPALASAFAAMAIRPLAGEPHQMTERVTREAALWLPVIRANRIRVES